MQLSLENKYNPKNDETWQRDFFCYRLFGFFSNLKFFFCFVSSLSSFHWVWVCVCVCVYVCVCVCLDAATCYNATSGLDSAAKTWRGWTGVDWQTKRLDELCVCVCVCVCMCCVFVFLRILKKLASLACLDMIWTSSYFILEKQRNEI
jgi:hypothetical protein